MLHPLMNNTKWEELRIAMYGLASAPRFYTLSQRGYRYGPDSEWYYHFREGGYEDIVHVDILANDPPHRELIRSAIKQIHLPGEETEFGFRIYGYAQPGQAINYL